MLDSPLAVVELGAVEKPRSGLFVRAYVSYHNRFLRSLIMFQDLPYTTISHERKKEREREREREAVASTAPSNNHLPFLKAHSGLLPQILLAALATTL